ncbi:4Fe-4S dicluster domain-containing protein [Paracidovorax citrulli]|uniref:4Fe-4S ferredoxin, iron-sulfur binding domain protein n=2 Tax=Paracidovorax citrulli TaxID=80869 RepID=A1TI39_PARC0|nr:4Fe-4S binding protein [Paracidovorax citrulli]ABM30627.1 4Fe-4S ferredoxin, iron-sulfur binding domain protein [Paracidovorax citrulli AAC00-1]ATG96169.1 4Fe-4S ferredoxin [Paracidovorax citrulli]PVY64794.1 4Fe-4S dicluster protein [Paracidovorax citrulli]REG71009.1 4Fe-4S dicluster protein [Paracidovorax citrulli]RLJ95562.1 4Fe-4S dicluster protein [Paracidovorax citrulli]
MPPSTPKALPAIDPDRCTGCGRCVAVCAPHVLSLDTGGSPGREGAPPLPWGPKRSVLRDPAGCTGCALCAVHCPFDAIRMERTGPR